MITSTMKKPDLQRSPSATPTSPLPAKDAAAGGGLGPLIERARWLEALDRRLRGCLPASLAPHFRLGNVRDQTLVFLVASPVWKAALRLHEQELLAAALEAGVSCRSVAVKVVMPEPRPMDPPPAPPLSAAARDALRSAARLRDPS